ncbi:hypothetical protein [Tetragenococcus halophilus]|uniref:Uncharacterized protein n=1 Tax=Tetragenococcus halophilus TaxID=51669 RepID=A0AB37D1T7_TETHA|nr:hypothetical protein [Tetragenococcus halophilus]QGP76186.1 hypothetical protein GLW17_04765 [Tetragenococcus halophilus]WJS82375.1 hypothetical protein KFZ55_02090 [Tetragenococcus halophilus]
MDDNCKVGLHYLQEKKYKKQGKQVPIGLIKFIDKCHIDDLVDKNEIYFNNINDFGKGEEDHKDIRKDDKEGKYCVKGVKEINIENVMERYHLQTYIASFTLLFEEDFDKYGKLTKEKLELLKEIEGNRCRPFIIINFRLFRERIKELTKNTPRLKNKRLPSPKIEYTPKKKIGIIYGGLKEVDRIYEYIDNNLNEKSLKSKAKEQLTNCRDVDSDILRALNKIDCTKNVSSFQGCKEEPEEFVFHGGYVYYKDNFDPFTKRGKEIIEDKAKFNELSESDQYEYCKKLIECCITLKDNAYAKETEYRILISNFSFDKNLDGVKLISDSKQCEINFPFKKHTFGYLDDLKREDFPCDDLLGQNIGKESEEYKAKNGKENN